MSEKEAEKERKRIGQSLFASDDPIPSKKPRLDVPVLEKSGKHKIKDEQQALDKLKKKEKKGEERSRKASKHAGADEMNEKRDGSSAHRHKDSSGSRKSDEGNKLPKVNVDHGGRQSLSKTPESVSGGYSNSSKSSDQVKHHRSTSKTTEVLKQHGGINATSKPQAGSSSSSGKTHTPSSGQKDVKTTDSQSDKKSSQNLKAASKDSPLDKKSSHSHSSSKSTNPTSVSASQKATSSKDGSSSHHRSESSRSDSKPKSSGGRSETGSKSVPGSDYTKAVAGSVKYAQSVADVDQRLKDSTSHPSPVTSPETVSAESALPNQLGSGTKTNTAAIYSSLLDDMKSDSDDLEVEDGEIISPAPIAVLNPHFDSPHKDKSPYKSKSNHDKNVSMPLLTHSGNSKDKISRAADEKLAGKLEKLSERPDKSVPSSGAHLTPTTEKRHNNLSSKADGLSGWGKSGNSKKSDIPTSPQQPSSQVSKSHNGFPSGKDKLKQPLAIKHDAFKASHPSPSKLDISATDTSKHDSSSSSSSSSSNDTRNKSSSDVQSKLKPQRLAVVKKVATETTVDKTIPSSFSVSPANPDDMISPMDVLSPASSDSPHRATPTSDVESLIGTKQTEEFSGLHVAPNGETLDVLLQLQEHIMTMTDYSLLQEVVNVIEETGKFQMNTESFEFDLCSLDAPTVARIKQCLQLSSSS